MVLHGETLSDPYAWMKNLTRDDPDLLAHLQAENAWTSASLADTTALQETLYAEMRSRIKETDMSVPSRRGRYLYYFRMEEGKQYSVYCRRKLKDGSPEEVLLDENQLAEGKKFFQVGAMALSPSGNFLAYAYDDVGFRQYKLVVKNLRTGKTLATHAERVTSVVFAADNQTLFYTTEHPETKRSNCLFRHKIGQKRHHLIFEEKDEFFRISVGKARSGQFIYLSVSSHTTSTVAFIKAAEPRSEFRLLAERKPMVRYDVEDDGDNFYILHNDGAKDFRLLKVASSAPEQENWQEVLAHRPGTLITGVDVFKDFLVVYEKSGLQTIRVHQFSTGETHFVSFPEPAYHVGPGANHEFDTQVLRLGYQSMVTPSTVYDYDLVSRQFTTLKVQEVKGYDPSLYATERIFATSDDGVTKIPMSVVYRKDKPLYLRPLLLYGYGSYGHGMPVTFSGNRLSLLDRGVVFVIAHVRGGNEYGEGWRESGKMKLKMNTFKDFIACADHLVKIGYTSYARLAIQGGSAGGLLLGAVLNLRPDVCRAALLQVPFVDVINTMLDTSLPLTVAEFEEWGNPQVPDDYAVIREYSPYENIRPSNYPAILCTSSLWDSQVGFWEPAKYVARLREMKTGTNPVLFKIHLEAGGHGGMSGRFDVLKDLALEYAFVLSQIA